MAAQKHFHRYIEQTYCFMDGANAFLILSGRGYAAAITGMIFQIPYGKYPLQHLRD